MKRELTDLIPIFGLLDLNHKISKETDEILRKNLEELKRNPEDSTSIYKKYFKEIFREAMYFSLIAAYNIELFYGAFLLLKNSSR